MSRLNSIRRTLRTVRHLKASQLAWRIRYVLERRLKLNRPTKTFSNVGSELRDGKFPMPPLFHHAGSADHVEQLKRGEFCCLHRTINLGRTAPDWMLTGHDTSGLWSITLHYHSWAYDLAVAAKNGDAEAFALYRHYIEDWIERCHLSVADVNPLIWNAFAISTRLGWWIRSLAELGPQLLSEVPQLEPRMLSSMCEQADHLSRHIEWDLRANHVMRDAAGLAWAGRFLKVPQAAEWSKQAAEIAIGQVEEQILEDGGHYERSPMYHIHVMEDVLSLAMLLTDDAAQKTMRDAWTRMAGYLKDMRHPDGHIPLFNDGAHHAVCDATRMLQLGQQCFGITIDETPQSNAFDHTGTAAWHGEPWTVFFDAAAVGPDFQPGHTHADSLTLECSYGSNKLFVDPGTYDYCTTQRRYYDRSTQSHNTVCVDDTDSSEVWGVFRTGRRAYPQDVNIRFTADRADMQASHDGYDFLPGKPRHARHITIQNSGSFHIKDEVTGSGIHKLDGGFLLDPSWSAISNDTGWRLTHEDGDCLAVETFAPKDVSFEVTDRPFHPEYGRELTVSRIQWEWKGQLPFKMEIEVRPDR